MNIAFINNNNKRDSQSTFNPNIFLYIVILFLQCFVKVSPLKDKYHSSIFIVSYL